AWQDTVTGAPGFASILTLTNAPPEGWAGRSPSHWLVCRLRSNCPSCPGGAGKIDSRCPGPKGASDFEGLTVSLKRYPDTKPEFSRSLKRFLGGDVRPQVSMESSSLLRRKSATCCTNAMISGCGLSSRDESCGWNSVAMKNKWAGDSMARHSSLEPRATTGNPASIAIHSNSGFSS